MGTWDDFFEEWEEENRFQIKSVQVLTAGANDVITKIPGRVGDLDVPIEYLPTPGEGTLTLAESTLIYGSGTLDGGEVSPPDDGYRFIYGSELLANSAFKSKVNDFMGAWDIALVINGNVDGTGYGGDAFSNDGSRSDSGSVVQISEGYPMQVEGVLVAGTDPLLEDAEVYIGNVLCAYTGTSLDIESWATFTCAGDGATGTSIKIQKKDDLALHLCGVMVTGDYAP